VAKGNDIQAYGAMIGRRLVKRVCVYYGGKYRCAIVKCSEKMLFLTFFLTNKPAVDGKSFMCIDVIVGARGRAAACTNGY
jgi:hypothetical protein